MPAARRVAEPPAALVRDIDRSVLTYVIVFSSRDHAADNKRTALGLGARAYVTGWSGLFQEIASVLE